MQSLGNWELNIEFTSVACILFLLENVLSCFYFWKFGHWNHFLSWIFTFTKKSNLGMTARDVNREKRIITCLYSMPGTTQHLPYQPPLMRASSSPSCPGKGTKWDRAGIQMQWLPTSLLFLPARTRVNRLLPERTWLIQHFRLCGPHHCNYSTPLLCLGDSHR